MNLLAFPGARESWRILATRGIRSVAQGTLMVDFTLFLKAKGWSALSIGELFTGMIFVQILFILAAGPMTDRMPKKPVMYGIALTQGILALVPLATDRDWVLVACSLICGFGVSGISASGPFSPIEMAWLARIVPVFHRGQIYSLNNISGLLGLSAGSALGMLPVAFGRDLSDPSIYRPAFLLFAVGHLLSFAMLRGFEEPPTRSEEAGPPPDTSLSREENRRLLQLIGTNALNGIGVGIFFPLLAWWFSVRFGKGPESLGIFFSLNYLLVAIGTLFTARLAYRIGVVRSVIVTRGISFLFLFVLPFVPSFPAACALYVVRAIFNQGSVGVRQSLSLNLVSERRHGLAGSVHIVSNQLPVAFGPAIAGYLYHKGHLALPFVIGGLFQSAYLFFYWKFFLEHDPNRLPAGEKTETPSAT